MYSFYVKGMLFSAIILVLIFVVVGALAGWTLASHNTKHRYSAISASAQQAKRRGVFVTSVHIAKVNENEGGGFPIKEAWIETVYEYDQKNPFRKWESGKRICIRVDYVQDKFFSEDVFLWNLKMQLNGSRLKSIGGRRDGKGMTFRIELDSDLRFTSKHQKGLEFPSEGTIELSNESANVQTRFQYSVK